MSGLWVWGMFAGALVAAGIAMALYAVAVPRRPALGALIAKIGQSPRLIVLTPPTTQQRTRRKLSGWFERLVDRPWMPVPTKDLAVVEKTRTQFLVERVLFTLLGLVVVPLLATLLWLIGAPVPPVIPVAASIALAGFFWITGGSRVKAAADQRRREMKFALVSYLTLIALHRAAGEGAASALERAAATSSSWAFRRIDRQVAAAIRSQQTPWEGLQELADELDIEELADLSSIAETGGILGAQIGATLLARASGLRHELLMKEQQAASEATERMTGPKMFIGLLFVVFILFPLTWTLLTSGGIQ